ncbi:hypothetical protein BC827DRAFT_819775 [Russula dissimulans]|nr:hypothetical protein BC827DRAFT_819775 [Russula dissimulans]
MGIPIILEERFDALSLRRYVKNTGRAYQRQAIELVNICRIFVETPSHKERRDVILKLTVLAVVEALRSATEAGKRVTSEASDAFQVAKEKLLQYRARVHPGTAYIPWMPR